MRPKLDAAFIRPTSSEWNRRLSKRAQVGQAGDRCAVPYLTIFPASVLGFPIRRSGIKILPVKLPIAPVPNEIVTLKNRTFSPVAKFFIDAAREFAKTLAKAKS